MGSFGGLEALPVAAAALTELRKELSSCVSPGALPEVRNHWI